MYTQGQIFTMAISKTIKFITIQEIKDSKILILNKAFGNTFRAYNQEGSQIQRIHVYPEFK